MSRRDLALQVLQVVGHLLTVTARLQVLEVGEVLQVRVLEDHLLVSVACKDLLMVGDHMVEMDRKWVMVVQVVLVPKDLVSKIFHRNQVYPVKSRRPQGQKLPLNNNPLCPHSSKVVSHEEVITLFSFKFLARECLVSILSLLK